MPALAHTATSSGPNAEILLLGGGMIVLALVFFFQKTVSTQASVVLGVLGAVAVTGAFTFAGESGTHGHEVSIELLAPEDGATVDAGAVGVEVALSGAELAGESTSDDAGHMHVYVDGEVVDMPSALSVEVELDQGEHEIEVEFVDSEHQALDPPVTDSVTVTAE
ncbi:MAG TPA: DUF4399 domain-containing protein [Actinomycetota bacterium]|nr:DUF4399 domain-containing protein [Actinomycetota bacterium]